MSSSKDKKHPIPYESKDRIAALKIAMIYLVVGVLWIFLSDTLLAIREHTILGVTQFSILKGCFYVLATAWMLYALIYRYSVSIRKSDREKRQSQESYRNIVETTQEGIWMFDAQLITTYANQQLADMLGYPIDEIIGRSVFDFIYPDMQQELSMHTKERLAGQAHPYDFCFRKKDGSDLWAIVAATSVMDEEGTCQGSFAMLTDITERKLTADRTKELEERQNDFYRRTILAATDGKLIITDDEAIRAIVGPSIAEWNVDTGENLASIRKGIREIVASYGMSEGRMNDFILCIGEAATNACKHAHGARASLHRVKSRMIFLVADNGPGIKSLILPEVALTRGYSTARSLGMGYKAMISIADRIYLSTGPTGTTVAIEMEISTIEKPVTLPDVW